MVIGNKTKKSRQHRLDRKKSISNEGNHPKRTTVSLGAIPLLLCSFCRHRPQLSLLVTQITSLISLFSTTIPQEAKMLACKGIFAPPSIVVGERTARSDAISSAQVLRSKTLRLLYHYYMRLSTILFGWQKPFSARKSA